LSIQIWRGRFHFQGEKLIYRRENYTIINEMLEYFSQRGLGGICFLLSFKKALPEDIIAFMHLLNDSAKQEDPAGWLDSALEKNNYSWVELYRKQDESRISQDQEQPSEQTPGMKRNKKARNMYFHAMGTVRDVTEKASGDVDGIRKARRLAQTIVDMVHEDSSILLQMASFSGSDDYAYMHSVNVALLATCLGKHMGLSQVLLENLTISALFHDLGLVGSVDEVPLKQGDLGFGSRDMLQRHPLVGLRKILQLEIPHSLRMRVAPSLFEHHLNLDLSGYPKTHFVKQLSLFGKIIHIADVYETLTSELVDESRRITPDEALRRMWTEKDKIFDTILLKNFISIMGIYPIGSVVELVSGEIGLVMEYKDESLKNLPLVMLLKDDGKGGMTQSEMVNLADQSMNESQRTILKSVPYSQIGIRPSQFFKEKVGAYMEFSSDEA
jgi:HD-GYP domain-containing protein (c-di-GMP phosphodiesterase class II)